MTNKQTNKQIVSPLKLQEDFDDDDDDNDDDDDFGLSSLDDEDYKELTRPK